MLLNVSVTWIAISTLLALILGVGIGFVLKTYIRDKKFDDRKSEAQKIVDDAKIEAERLKKESIQEAKETVSDMKRDAEIDIKERKDVVVELENKLNVREDTLDRRSSNLDRREEILNDKENRLDSKKTELEQLNNKVEEVLKQQETKLEEISNLTREQAKELIMNKVHEDVSSEIASYIKEEEEKAKLEVKNKAKDILSVAIQKYAGETVSETTVATVALPSDEMKGRIIGREGRNIRTIETMTGADLIIDDTPDAVVIVATLRALKMHGGVAKTDLSEENVQAVRDGFANLKRHVENVRKFGLPAVVAINEFVADTEAEIAALKELCAEIDVPVELASVWANGADGGIDLANAVVDAVENGNANYKRLYSDDDSLEEKITKIVTEIYGGKSVVFEKKAKNQLKQFAEFGWDKLPVCMAKTQYSFSDNQFLLGAPEGFDITIREFVPKTGAGFIVALTGDVMTMPGLPKAPAALKMDVAEDGTAVGLF